LSLRILESFCPNEYVESLADVEIEELMARGIDSVLLDLDNTILPWKLCDIPEESARWVSMAREKGLKMCIASNTHNPRRLRRLAEELGLPCLHRILKPRRRGLSAALRSIGSEASKTAMIGDQVFTDVVGGRRMGMYTILVKPMARREFVGTKLSRIVERWLLAYFRRRGMIGTKKAAG
jgi:uncharacterized protein